MIETHVDELLIDEILSKGHPYVLWAVPVFFVLIGLELMVAWRWKKPLYRFNDSINDLACGILQQTTGIFLKIGAYAVVYQATVGIHVIEVEGLSAQGKWAAALALFLGVDFAYYWFHRISHQMNAPWAAHIVHHQSEEYNLAVALRQSSLQTLFSFAFYLPLAVIGFPPLWFIAMSAFNTLYQFWIHTRAIGKLGPLEWVLNTPSHHRVHHGRNPKYLDRNHAGSLIIWDRMFGTFQEEDEEPVYGIVRPLDSWNPLWANVHEYVELGKDAWAAPYAWDKIKIWFMPPGWRPRGLPERESAPDLRPEEVLKYDPKVSAGLSAYVAMHFLVALGLGVCVMSFGAPINGGEPMSLGALAIPAVLCAWTLLDIGAIFEHARWALWSEILRLLAVSGSAIAFWGAESPVVLACSAWTLASLVWLTFFRAEFDGVRFTREPRDEFGRRVNEADSPDVARVSEREPVAAL